MYIYTLTLWLTHYNCKLGPEPGEMGMLQATWLTFLFGVNGVCKHGCWNWLQAIKTPAYLALHVATHPSFMPLCVCVCVLTRHTGYRPDQTRWSLPSVNSLIKPAMHCYPCTLNHYIYHKWMHIIIPCVCARVSVFMSHYSFDRPPMQHNRPQTLICQIVRVIEWVSETNATVEITQ